MILIVATTTITIWQEGSVQDNTKVVFLCAILDHNWNLSIVVMFWGYDKMMEVSFYLETAVLKQLCPEMSNAEVEFLKAFDNAREMIYEVAGKVYKRGGSGKGTYAYVLAAEDF